MWHRFFVLLYVFAIAACIGLPALFFVNEAKWDKNIITTYKVRCANGKDLILHGSEKDEPATYSEYRMESQPGYYEDMWKFYCANYDEVRDHILKYRNAESMYEQYTAHEAFLAFRNGLKSMDLWRKISRWSP